MTNAGRILLAALTLTVSSTAAISQQPRQSQFGAYGKLPLSFEANRGQTDPSVKFLSRGAGYSLHLTNSAAVLSLAQSPSSNND